MSAKTFKAAAVATLAGLGLSTSVLADNAWNCEAVTFQGGAVSDEQCAGSFSPPPVTLAIANSQFVGDAAYSGFFKDDNSAIGSTTFAIDAVGTGNGRGSITFNVGITDSFVLELKFGQEWSVFRFDDDVTAGTTWTFGLPGTDLQGLGLSHASIATVPAIPEPHTYVLMLAGVGAVGFMARRRRQA
jgi:hypothetical protein